MWDAIWNALNSPVVIAVIVVAVAWIITKIVTGKPAWEAWTGTIISAIRWAEKEIPDDTANAGAKRLDAALKYVLNIYEQATGKPADGKTETALKEGIQILHDDVEPNLEAKKGEDFPTGSAFTLLLIGIVLMFTAGCNYQPAAVTTDLLTYDNIASAATEIGKGIDAYDTATAASSAKVREQVLSALGKDVVALAGKQLPPEHATALGLRVQEAMAKHLVNFAEQDRRAAKLYDACKDNLAYIGDLCAKGKDFTLYRSSIEQQFRAYLMATAKKVIPTAPVVEAVPVVITVPSSQPVK